jgi:hypothetical protein
MRPLFDRAELQLHCGNIRTVLPGDVELLLISKEKARVSFLTGYRERIAKFCLATLALNLLNVKATIVQVNLVSQGFVDGGDGAE